MNTSANPHPAPLVPSFATQSTEQHHIIPSNERSGRIDIRAIKIHIMLYLCCDFQRNDIRKKWYGPRKLPAGRPNNSPSQSPTHSLPPQPVFPTASYIYCPSSIQFTRIVCGVAPCPSLAILPSVHPSVRYSPSFQPISIQVAMNGMSPGLVDRDFADFGPFYCRIKFHRPTSLFSM